MFPVTDDATDVQKGSETDPPRTTQAVRAEQLLDPFVSF